MSTISATLLSNVPIAGAPSINFIPATDGNLKDDATSQPFELAHEACPIKKEEQDVLAPASAHLVSPGPTARSDTAASAPARGRVRAVTPECVEGALRHSSRHAKPARRFSPTIAPRAAAMKKLTPRKKKATRTATRAPVEVNTGGDTK